MATKKVSSKKSSSKTGGSKKGISKSAKVALVSAGVIAAGAAAYFLSDKKKQAKAKAWMVKMKDEAVKKFSNMGDMSKEMYHEAIDKIADKYQNVKDASPAEIAMMVAEMKRYWANLSKNAKGSAKKAVKKIVKKAVKKAGAKKVAKKK
jgi:hypothetical protein